METNQGRNERGIDMEKVKAEDLKNAELVPLGKNMILIVQIVDSDSRIEMPDNFAGSGYKERVSGMSVLTVQRIGEECTKVKVGDYVITKPNAASLSGFKKVDADYLSVHEDDVSAVMRVK